MAPGHDAIILMLVWLPQVFSDMGELPTPVNLILNSSNFIHLLTWQPGHGTPRGVSYNVSVNSDWDRSWKPVAGCALVEHPLVCNLTEAFTNPTYVYYNMVVAILRSQASLAAFQPGFRPIKDSELALPQLMLAACDQFLCVDLHPPLERLSNIYQSFQYQLRVTSNASSQPVEFLVNTRSLNRTVLRNLAPGVYCVSVRILDSEVPRKSVFSQLQCIPTTTTTTGVRTEDVFISVFLCLGVLTLAIVVLLEQTGVVCLKNTLPPVLTVIHPLVEGRLAVSRKEPVCSHIHIGAMSPFAGGKGKCATREDDSVGKTQELMTSGSVASVEGYIMPSSSSSFSSSSSSIHPLLASPLQSEHPPPSQGHVTPHTGTHLAPSSPLRRCSELCADAFTTPRSVAALRLPRGTDPWAPSLEKEVEAGVGPWEGCNDVNLLSLTFGDKEAYRAMPPPTADEEEVAMETVISDEEVDEE